MDAAWMKRRRKAARMNLLAEPRLKFEILLIEDNAADARLVSLALKGFEADYQLRIIRDGGMALDFIGHKDHFQDAPWPDVVLLDWMLPVAGGAEILAEIRRTPELRDIPVIVVSGIYSAEVEKSIYEAGANTFIEKPITLDRFSIILQHFMDALKRKREIPPPPDPHSS